MSGRLIQMPKRPDRSQDEEVSKFQDAVMLFHESANCPGIWTNSAWTWSWQERQSAIPFQSSSGPPWDR